MNAIKSILKSQFDTIVMTVDHPVRSLQKIVYKQSDFFEIDSGRLRFLGFAVSLEVIALQGSI